MRDLTQHTVSSKTICDEHIFHIERDQVRMPSGVIVTRSVVRKVLPGVIIVPLTNAGEVVLVRQWRYAVGQALIELPAGGMEIGEEPEDSVRRELQEEAGYLPQRVRFLGKCYPSPGFLDEEYLFYLADQLVESHLPGDEDEDIEIMTMSIAEALAHPIVQQDLKTMMGLLLVQARLANPAEGE